VDLTISLQFMATFSLVLSRVAGFFLFAPIFGTSVVSGRVRGMLIIVFATVSTLLIAPPQLPDDNVIYAALLIKELMVGFAMSFVIGVIFLAAQIAGSLIDTMVGYSMTSVLDPTTHQQSSILSQLYYLLAVINFIVLGGLEVMLGGLIKSFQLLPLTAEPRIDLISIHVMSAIGEMLIIGVQIAAPVLIAASITDIALGLVVRAMPQANIFAVGMPVKIIVGLVVVLLTLPAFLYFFGSHMDHTIDLMNQLIQSMR
jgi:flagellar biosynthetic protein FliR